MPHPLDRYLDAAARGDLATIRDANTAEPGGDVEADGRDYEGNNALHLAARGGHANVVWWLIDLGVDPMAQNHRGLTPLHECVVEPSERHLDVLAELLTCGIEDSSILSYATSMNVDECAHVLKRDLRLREGHEACR